MNPVTTLFKNFGKNTKDDLVKAVIGAVVGLLVTQVVENSYDNFKAKNTVQSKSAKS